MHIVLIPQIQMIMAAVLAVLTTSLVMRGIVFVSRERAGDR